MALAAPLAGPAVARAASTVYPAPALRGRSTAAAALPSCRGIGAELGIGVAAASGGLALALGLASVRRSRRSLEATRRRRKVLLRASLLEDLKRDRNRQIVLVVGGGIGGFNMAARLAEMPWPTTGLRKPPKILLVDPKDRFVFTPLLIDYAVEGEVELDEFAPTYVDLEEFARAERSATPSLPGTGPAEVDHIRGTVTSVDWRRREATVCESEGVEHTVRFDAAAFCPGQPPSGGAAGSLAASVEAGDALPFATLADGEALKARLEEQSPSTVAVVGAGYVGVELACALAEVVPRPEGGSSGVTLFGGSLLRGCEEPNQRRSAERLREQGVEWLQGRVTSIDSKGLSWKPMPSDKDSEADDIRFECDLTIVTGAAAQRAETRPERPPIRKSEADPSDDRAPVDEFLRAAPGIFCIGDAASAAGAPATGQAAMQQAEIAAWNLFAMLSGLGRAAWRQYKPGALGEFVSLGKSEAAGVVDASQFGKLVPQAIPPAAAAVVAPLVSGGGAGGSGSKVDLGGLPAALLRRLSYLYRMPTVGHRVRMAQQWAVRAKDGAPLPADGPTSP